jgi:branched-chain amino acid transport system permease protein
MQLFIKLMLVGLADGAIYALIALGYTMVYGIIELINFAHGNLFMLGTFMVITLMALFGITADQGTIALSWMLVAKLALVCIGSMLFCAILGVIIERIAYRPLRHAPRLAPLISAIGVALVLQDAGKLWKGNTNIAFPPINYGQLTIGSLNIRIIDLFAIAVAVVLMILLQLLVTRTKMGRAMRAVAQDREAAALMGVNVNLIISFTFFIGAALAGAAAFIFGLKEPNTIFTQGEQLGLIAFTAAVLGGIGNLTGAMLGGFVIGIISSLITYIPESVLPHSGLAWGPAFVFGILILILVFRPSGLLGQHVPEKV